MSDMPKFIRDLLENDQHMRLVSKVSEDRQNHFIAGLDSEDLATFSHILAATLTDAPPTSYWIGRIDQELLTRGVCTSCGVDHAAAELQALSGEVDDDEEEETPEPPHKDVPERPWVQDELDLKVVEIDLNAISIEDQMMIWNVQPVIRDVPLGKVECKACGWEWVNLGDRMLRPPGVDGCPGCQDKSAHG